LKKQSKFVNDLKGKRFGKLTVKAFAGIHEKSGKALWNCLCDCGNKKICQGTSMVMGWTSSCGCIAGDQNKLRPYEAVYNGVLRAANRRHISISLSYEEFISFTKETFCHYCEAPVVWAKHHRQKVLGGQRYNLDRVDNGKGYHKANLVTCCGRCNRGKLNLYSYEEWYGMTEYLRRKTANV
jgi:hypothetical protein